MKKIILLIALSIQAQAAFAQVKPATFETHTKYDVAMSEFDASKTPAKFSDFGDKPIFDDELMKNITLKQKCVFFYKDKPNKPNKFQFYDFKGAIVLKNFYYEDRYSNRVTPTEFVIHLAKSTDIDSGTQEFDMLVRKNKNMLVFKIDANDTSLEVAGYCYYDN